LLNRNAARFVEQVRAAGFECGLSSNAALLSEARATELLDAGLTRVFLNVGDRDDEYEAVYQLPFEKTRDNVVRFAELAEGRCEVHLVLVDHRADPAHQATMRDYWRERGINRFIEYGVINRGGALFVDHMQFESYPELAQAREMLAASGVQPACAVPFLYLFVGYDGLYYLCCSDWKKEAPLGSVFDTSFLAVTAEKLRHVSTREPVCKTCNHDPLNRLTEQLRAVNSGAGDVDAASVDALLEELVTTSAAVRRAAAEVPARFEASRSDRADRSQRKRIPVQVTT
jgi:uncharacterized protein with von Willebrand factor type A (vWA) domain